jgi:hypothetical protein
MTDPRLSPELEQIQRELAAQPRDDPPLLLRARTMDGVRVELRRERSVFDRYLLAAAALVWVNLALSATNATQQPSDLPKLRELDEPLVRQIEQLLPELSDKDARRLAVLYREGSGLVPCPDVPSWSALGRRPLDEEI